MITEHPFVEVENLSRHFDVSKPWLNRVIERQPVQILRAVDGVSFSIPKGKTFALVGESGCGKSTIAKLCVGLYRPTTGSIRIDNTDIAALRSRAEVLAIRRRLSMIFQDPYASLNPRWHVADIVAEPIRAHHLLEGNRAIRARVDELLGHVGLSSRDGEKFPHEFSGGQRQRISIARALASNPEFIVCDEPTSALDVSVQAQILNLMRDLQRELGLTYLFISHNLAVVSFIADEIGVMYLGKLAERAETRTLFTRPMHPYTRMLLDAVPDLAMTGRQRVPVQGEVPNPISPPSGCRFHPRCPYANNRCRQETPALLPIKGVATPGSVACHAVEEHRLPPPT